jgi:rhodanese-related sulfurtransferase
MLKFIFRKSSGKVLGAQALGEDGPAADQRISAMAIQMGATIYDLEESELCYESQFGSAKDPVNFAGVVAADVLRGDIPLSHWDTPDGAFLFDLRMPVELVVESMPGALHIPLPQLRGRLGELPATVRFMSSAVPLSAPTARRASCCRTGSRRKTSPAVRCHPQCEPLLKRNNGGLFRRKTRTTTPVRLKGNRL